MIYRVDVPYVTMYSHWVEADSEKEAVDLVKGGVFHDVEETGEVTGTFLWKKFRVAEDPIHTRKMSMD